MENAIKRSIEGGYEPRRVHSYYAFLDMGENIKVPLSAIPLDPLFWQALGKAEGNENFYPPYKSSQDITNLKGGQMIWWKVQMHRFIDHIIEGKLIDEFFNNLLK